MAAGTADAADGVVRTGAGTHGSFLSLNSCCARGSAWLAVRGVKWPPVTQSGLVHPERWHPTVNCTTKRRICTIMCSRTAGGIADAAAAATGAATAVEEEAAAAAAGGADAALSPTSLMEAEADEALAPLPALLMLASAVPSVRRRFCWFSSLLLSACCGCCPSGFGLDSLPLFADEPFVPFPFGEPEGALIY